MNASSPHTTNREQVTGAVNGWLMAPVNLALYAIAIASIVFAGSRHEAGPAFLGAALLLVSAFVSRGFFMLQPNEAAVLTLFGRYSGTVRESGVSWVNPLLQRQKVSVRARNFNSEKIKVNDKRGNPIEIAAVVVWRVRDTAQATFDVESFRNYVEVQSESAVRHVASNYVYDDGDASEITLRGGGERVSEALTSELQERLSKAGVDVEEARLTHLAYAPEIAQTMLRRQQAEAVIAARQKIVSGAVGMVDMALRELSSKQVVTLDEERKAAMVSNLLVVLCSESQAQPVLNTGTLYT
jgi:regulator of protease activity HflC (stomatin/prohibitin superfamily)